ncbi:hypothetical protein AGDE_12882 [Angomonas deanei]|nr:hypothetical protein AGDE_12882 [Angomonas deanei]|eukprot:EPY23381.1 hypothetical protein AGDE_12882 [Angomonas deanei]
MAKKREEREKRQRESAPTTVPGSNVHTPSVSAPATPSVTPAVVPPAAVEELSLPQTSEAPPLKKVKEDDVVLILDNSEEDLYAGLSRYEADGSGRHHRPQYSNANNYYANQSGGNSTNSAGPSGGGYNYYQQQR